MPFACVVRQALAEKGLCSGNDGLGFRSGLSAYDPIAGIGCTRLSPIKKQERHMPNGKAGDHPLTDILHYGSSEFGEPVDGVVKEMAQSERFFQVRDEVANVLWDCSPAWRQADKDALVARALDQLRALQQRLRDDR
jgi:hypothetical protein